MINDLEIPKTHRVIRKYDESHKQINHINYGSVQIFMRMLVPSYTLVKMILLKTE